MFHRCVMFGLVVISFLGCSKPNGGRPPEKQAAPHQPAEPPPTYSLKLRGEREGDRTSVVRTRTGTSIQTFGGKVTTRKLDYRYEFTETVLQTKPGVTRPTKLNRSYTAAWRIPNDDVGAVLTHSYVGKMVTIEKDETNGGYVYSADGTEIPLHDLDGFRHVFDMPDRADLSVLLPSKQVGVDESWPPDVSQTVKAVVGSLPFGVDSRKSRVTATLKRIDRRNNQLWAAIEVSAVIYFAETPQSSGLVVTDPQNVDVTIEAVADGSAGSITTTIRTKGIITVNDPRVGQVKVVADTTEKESRTPQQ